MIAPGSMSSSQVHAILHEQRLRHPVTRAGEIPSDLLTHAEPSTESPQSHAGGPTTQLPSEQQRRQLLPFVNRTGTEKCAGFSNRKVQHHNGRELGSLRVAAASRAPGLGQRSQMPPAR
jgi:hypothetical protein